MSWAPQAPTPEAAQLEAGPLHYQGLGLTGVWSCHYGIDSSKWLQLFHPGWASPRQQDGGSLQRCRAVLHLFMLAQLFAFPRACWHTKHSSTHLSPDIPCGLQIPSCTAPTSPRNPLPGKGGCCFHHQTEGRENLWAKSTRKRDRSTLSLIKCAIQNLVNREMKSSCWEMEREIAFWPWGNLCLSY